MLSEQEHHLHDYLRVLQKRRWTVIAFFVILVSTVAVGTVAMSPVYRSTAQVLIERDNPNVVSIQDVLAVDATATDYYQTQYEILKSETLARRVIARMPLDRDPDFAPDGDDRSAEEIERRRVRLFLSRLQVIPVRNSRIVRLEFQSKDPLFAAEGANRLVEEYIRYNLELRLKAELQAGDWLRQRVDEMQGKVRASEEAFERFRETIPVRITAQIESKAAMREMESRPEVVNNKFIQELRAEEIRLTARRAELSEKYGPRHPQIIQIQAELNTLQEKLDREVRRLVGAVKIEESPQYLLLKREMEANRQLYDVLLKRLKETTLTQDLPRSNVQIVDAARPAHEPFKPRMALNLLLAVLFGLGGGVVLAFFFEYLDNTIHSPEDVERLLGVPLLGIVPSLERGKGPARAVETILRDDPRSAQAEAYRTIRTGVLLSLADRTPRVVLVTSPGPMEGKTATAANLAAAMAQAGSSTLLMDADLRRPRVHRIFAQDDAKGLGPVLAGQATLEGVIRQTSHPLLSVLTAGPLPPNPAELLGSQRMRDVMAELSGKFDRIVIDSPPLIPVTDSTLLATLADGVVLVVKESHTTRRFAAGAVKRLAEAKARVLGAVLNDVDLKKGRSYHYPYYSYERRDADA